MSETMTGAEMVVRALQDQDVAHIFGYPGGAVLPIYDAIFQQNSLEHILVRHEQGAVHAAEGYARSSGKVGVVLVTSGPGATNAVTGLTDALLDSIPVVCFTGQVPTHLIGSDAFQECDTVGITRHCTKHNYLVKRVEDLPRIIHEAFYVARSGRPGPVVIDIPKDVQFATGVYTGPGDVTHKSYRPKVDGDIARIEAAVALMAKAKRPVFYTGGGVVNAGPKASKLLTQLVHMTGFPITNTLMGLGAYPGSDRQFLGMVGMHGTWEANHAMHQCDLMIAVGSRFDDRVAGKVKDFAPNARYIAHIDIDAAVEERLEVRAGSAPDEAVYVDSLRRRRDLSVLLLLDVSGSAAEPGSLGRTVHQQQRTVAAALTVALHDLGDRVALFAYNSHGRQAVNLLPVKRFDEALGTVVLRRLNSLEPTGYSRLGAAIRHGAAVLEADGGTARRLLVVLSDGLAYDHGYEREHGAADARRALTEARRRGTGCVCLTVGAGTEVAALRAVFGSAAHATVGRPDQLPAVIGPLFRAAIRSAEVRRRLS